MEGLGLAHRKPQKNVTQMTRRNHNSSLRDEYMLGSKRVRGLNLSMMLCTHTAAPAAGRVGAAAVPGRVRKLATCSRVRTSAVEKLPCLPGLSTMQEHAVRANGHLHLVGGPGSGKTQVRCPVTSEWVWRGDKYLLRCCTQRPARAPPSVCTAVPRLVETIIMG